MSLSQPTRRANYRRNKYVDYMDDSEYLALHWTKQLELRPLRNQPHRTYEQGDFDTYIDMFDDNEIIDKEK
jgi:hypothetical protein